MGHEDVVSGAEGEPGLTPEISIIIPCLNEEQNVPVLVEKLSFLLENYGQIPWITQLVKDRVFYIVPTINPDARDDFLHRRFVRLSTSCVSNIRRGLSY